MGFPETDMKDNSEFQRESTDNKETDLSPKARLDNAEKVNDQTGNLAMTNKNKPVVPESDIKDNSKFQLESTDNKETELPPKVRSENIEKVKDQTGNLGVTDKNETRVPEADMKDDLKFQRKSTDNKETDLSSKTRSENVENVKDQAGNLAVANKIKPVVPETDNMKDDSKFQDESKENNKITNLLPKQHATPKHDSRFCEPPIRILREPSKRILRRPSMGLKKKELSFGRSKTNLLKKTVSFRADFDYSGRAGRSSSLPRGDSFQEDDELANFIPTDAVSTPTNGNKHATGMFRILEGHKNFRLGVALAVTTAVIGIVYRFLQGK